MTHDDVIVALATHAPYLIVDPLASPVLTTDAGFNSQLPTILQDAEQRIYRELDFLAIRRIDATSALIPGNDALTLPADVDVLEQVNIITPPGVTPLAGTRNPLLRLPLAFLAAVWPTPLANLTLGVPLYYAMTGGSSIRVAPTPDTAYGVELVYSFIATPLSHANPTTYLTLMYPDLFLAACMVYLAAWQKNFGAQSDNPQQALSWETHYQMLKASAQNEEQRRKSALSVAISPTAAPAPQPTTLTSI